jgi:hypothetical protein
VQQVRLVLLVHKVHRVFRVSVDYRGYVERLEHRE